MKIILTGAAGFIGSCFLKKLNLLGIDHVYAVDTASTVSGIQNLAGKKLKEYFSREELPARLEKKQLEDVDAVIHLGACSDTTEMDRGFLTRNNFEYSRVLATWALSRKKIFHYASSASVYGNGREGYKDDSDLLSIFSPLNPYAESKIQFDRWIFSENLEKKVVGFRYFNVFGPNEYHKGDMRSMVCKSFDQIQSTGKARLFANTRPGYDDGSETRDFVYVKDVNDVMAYFLEHPDKHGIFNVGTGKARSFKDLVSAVFASMGKKPNIEYIPMPDKLKSQYQYFTEADLSHLRSAGYQKPFQELETSVADYVQNHLAKTDKYY